MRSVLKFCLPNANLFPRKSEKTRMNPEYIDEAFSSSESDGPKTHAIKSVKKMSVT